MTPVPPCRVFSYVDFRYIREIRDVRQTLPPKKWRHSGAKWFLLLECSHLVFGQISKVGLGLKNMSNPKENKQESIPWAG